MTSQDSLEVPHASEFANSLDSENETTQGMVVKPSKRPGQKILTPQGSRRTDLCRRIKCRLGCTLKSRFHRRFMISSRETTAHKCTRTKSSNPSPSTLFKTVHQEISASSLRQHYCSSPHKQTRRNSLSRAFCPHVETPYLVQQTPDNSQSETRPKVTQCHCGRPLQEEPNSTHRVVPVSSDIQIDHSTLGASSDRPVCHQPKHDTPNLRVSHSRSTGMGGGCTEHLLEEHSRLRHFSHSTPAQSVPEITVPGMQAHPDSPGLANKSMVLGSGETVS